MSCIDLNGSPGCFSGSNFIHCPAANFHEAHCQDEVDHLKSPSWELMGLMVPHHKDEDHDAGSDELPTGFCLHA